MAGGFSHCRTHLGLPYCHRGRGNDTKDLTGARHAQGKYGFLERDARGLSGVSATPRCVRSCGIEEVVLDRPDARRMGRERSARNGNVQA